MYINLFGDKDVGRRYGEGVVSVSVEEFQAYAVHIFDDLENSNWKSFHVWTAPDKINSLRYTNDRRYFEGDGTSWME